jgi:PIN domain nuclease of toxin-antitoxin system
VSFLLDTAALLWWLMDDARLGNSARATIQDPKSLVYMSSVSAWEIATKHRLGKLTGVEGIIAAYDTIGRGEGFRELPVASSHALRAGAWPVAHRDPFDRVLAAQSELESLVLITRDAVFGAFGISTLW